MAYEPTTWQSGDVVTSAKLNKLETAAAPFIVTFTVDWSGDDPTATADKTLTEIEAAWDAGMVVYFDMDGTIVPAERETLDDVTAWKATSADYQSTLISAAQGTIDAENVFYVWREYDVTPK